MFFSQDDFFHLKLGQLSINNNVLDIFSFRSFNDRGGVYFYRPIFRELLYKYFYQIFGFNSFPFRILQFLILFLNSFLIYFIQIKLTKSKFISIFSSFFSLFAVANIGVLSYLAGGIQVSGMVFFSLLSIIFYLKYLEKESFLKFFIFVIFNILALCSHEISVSLPLIYLLIYIYVRGFTKENIIKSLKLNFFSFSLSISLLAAEIFVIGLPLNEAQYGISLSLTKILNSYFWYGLWSLGIPEMLIDFVGPGFNLNPDLMRFWGVYFIFIFSSFVCLLLIFITNIKKIINDKRFWFFSVFFILGIFPVILVPLHKQYVYLSLVIFAVGAILGIIAEKIKSKIFLLVFIFSVVVLNISSIFLAQKTYWALSRNEISEVIINQIKREYPSLPKGSKIYIINDPNYPNLGKDWGGSSTQASVILSGSDGLQMLYNDLILKVYYEDIKKPEAYDEFIVISPRVERK